MRHTWTDPIDGNEHWVERRDCDDELAATGAGPSSCSECDDYDAEAIASCPHCLKPVCDGCMHNWHTNGICCPEG